jgi:hypothetical protein
VNLLPQSNSLTAVYFAHKIILPLASRFIQQRADRARHKLLLISTIRSATLIGMSKNKWPVIDASLFRTAIIYPICQWRILPVQAAHATLWENLDSEQNELGTVVKILSASPKTEVKSAFLHWKERCHWVADDHGDLYPRSPNTQIFWSCERDN